MTAWARSVAAWVLVLVGCSAERGEQSSVDVPAKIDAPAEVEAPSPPPVSAPLPSKPPELVPVALRDGPMYLLPHGDRGLLFVEDRLLSIGRAGLSESPSEGMQHPRGLLAPFDYAEDPSGGAWLVFEHFHPRTGNRFYADVFRRTEARWSVIEAPDSPRLESYSALIERDGAVMGLRAYTFKPETTGPEVPVRDESRLADVPKGFARLSGSPTATRPELPTTLPSAAALERVTSTPDGSVYGLIESPDSPLTLLVWPPGDAQARSVSLPESTGIELARFSTVGDEVLVHGSQRYLALGRRDEWRRIPIELPDVPELSRSADLVSSALHTPSGELWLIVSGGAGTRLLYQAPGSAWTIIEPPPPSAELMPTERWYFDQQWMRAEVIGEPAHLRELAWIDGRVWLLLDFGMLESSEAMPSIQREGLYTLAPFAAPTSIFPSLDQLWFEAAAKHGGPDTRACQAVWIGLGVDRYASLNEQRRSALRAVRDELDDAHYTTLLYEGETTGQRELVLQLALPDDRSQLGRYVRKVGAAVGHRTEADCRPRGLVEVIEADPTTDGDTTDGDTTDSDTTDSNSSSGDDSGDGSSDDTNGDSSGDESSSGTPPGEDEATGDTGPGAESERGCGCATSNETSWSGGLALLGLLALRRRRGSEPAPRG